MQQRNKIVINQNIGVIYCDEIIFDSDKDNWSRRKSTLNEIIKGRSHLVFIIEDDNYEMFGFYFNKQISVNEKYSENDDKSFYFILNSKRKTSSLKFNIESYKRYGIHLFSKHSDKLIRLGDISLFKEDSKEKSNCRGINGSHDGNYYGINDGLCGIDQRNNGQLFFIPKRILVIQMG